MVNIYKQSNLSWKLILVLAIAMIGCRAEPFERAALPVLNNPDPSAIRRHFADLIPDYFTSDDTVVLQAPFRDDLAVLGVLNVDRKAGTFELYGLNQMGVQYFHIAGNRQMVAIRDAVPPLMQHKDILLSMARDIQRIYFNLLPKGISIAALTPTMITFTRKTVDGDEVYRFGYQPAVLLDKQLGDCFGPTWRVRYYDYKPGDGGKLFPHGIVMDNFHFHYRIIIKNRDWSVEEAQ